MSHWLTDVSALTDKGEPCVLVTVVSTRGSVPREAGTRMVVSHTGCFGTIGGGHLEYRATDIAREQLTDANRPETFSARFPLGASLGQCCGGLVYLLFERLADKGHSWLDFVREHDRKKQAVVMVTQLLPDEQNPRNIACIRRLVVSEDDSIGELVDIHQPAIDYARRRISANNAHSVVSMPANSLPGNGCQSATPGHVAPCLSKSALLFETLQADVFAIHIFGAGHVGQAIVNVLSGLACKVRWIDSRHDQFPDTLPANVETVLADQPQFELDNVSPGGFVLIMTHSHALDEAICERALQRHDLAYCGLIGSESKRRNFIRRFKARGMQARAIDRLTCPIGMPGLSGKHPAEIAIAVSAQLLHVKESGAPGMAVEASFHPPALQSA